METGRKTRILEIGNGGKLIGMSLEQAIMRIPDTLEYHGIDNNERYLRRSGLAVSELNERCIFLEGADGRALPFNDKVFDEVHLHYVVTDVSVSGDDIKRMLLGATRTLKDSGKIIVSGELSEPPILNNAINVAKTELQRLGLAVMSRKYVRKSDFEIKDSLRTALYDTALPREVILLASSRLGLLGSACLIIAKRP